MVTLADPSSAGQEPESQRKVFTLSRALALVTVVAPRLFERQRVQVGAIHDAMPPSMAESAPEAPMDEGAVVAFTR